MTGDPTSSLTDNHGTTKLPPGDERGEVATFAAGCFWGVEDMFRKLPGVIDAEAGYTGGDQVYPTYEQVCAGTTGHAEAVRVLYDPAKTSFGELADAFFANHDPTTRNRQGPDVGNQYRSGIFVHSDEQRAEALDKIRAWNAGRYGGKIVTLIEDAGPFWRAEEYHQCYLQRR